MANKGSSGALVKAFSALNKTNRFIKMALIVFPSVIVLLTIALVVVEKPIGEYGVRDVIYSVIFTVFQLGDFAEMHPVTHWGRIIILIIGLSGIVLFAAIFSSYVFDYINKKIKEVTGMSKVKFTKHIVIWGWNQRTDRIINELNEECNKKIALISQSDKCKKEQTDKYHFIEGKQSDEKALEFANVAEAESVIIMAEDMPGSTNHDVDAIDAKSILRALVIEKITESKIYSVIELLNENNANYARLANVNDIIFPNSYGSAVLALSVVNQGISRLLNDLLSYGPVPPDDGRESEYSKSISHSATAKLVGIYTIHFGGISKECDVQSLRDDLSERIGGNAQFIPFAYIRNQENNPLGEYDVFLNKERKYKLQKGDKILIIAYENDWEKWKQSPCKGDYLLV